MSESEKERGFGHRCINVFSEKTLELAGLLAYQAVTSFYQENTMAYGFCTDSQIVSWEQTLKTRRSHVSKTNVNINYN